METSSFRSLPGLGADDPLFINQWPSNNPPHVELSTETVASLIYENFHPSYQQQQPILDFKRAAESPGPWPYRPAQQLRPTTTSWESENMFISDSNLSDPSLGMVKPKEETMSSSYYKHNKLNSPYENIPPFGNQDYIVKPGQGSKREISSTNARMAQTPQDHILAERKRREKISQRFIALSALVPGLKKMDKASVLGDATKYLKQLQERVKILEERTKKKSMEKYVFVKKYEIWGENGESSCTDESFSDIAPAVAEPLPEIQARFCDKDVLIIINCEKRKGVFEKAVSEIEKLNLSVANSCVMAFGDSALNITLLAKKDEGLALDMKEMVDNLRQALKIFV